jgi:3-hydroxybutyrate dehydrogenase
MTTTLDGRRALVTGGASGIGLACARRLAAEGADVTVADVNGAAATRIADEVGGAAWEVDLTDPAALAQVALDCDVLVNNAGVQHVAPIEEFPPDRFRAMLVLMLETPFLLVRAALPHIEKQIADQARIHGLAEDEVVDQVMLTESAIKRLIEPDEVADLVAWLAGQGAGYVNGASMSIDGGWTAR